MLKSGSSARIVLLVTLILVCRSATAMGASGEGWSLRIDGFAMSTTGGVPRSGAFENSIHVGGGDGDAWGISCEYRRGELLGLELGAIGARESDLTYRIASPAIGTRIFTKTLRFGAYLGGVNFHLMPESRLDLYAGPTFAYVEYNDVIVSALDLQPDESGGSNSAFPEGASIQLLIDNDFAIGANVGLDVPMGDSGWLFNVNARYLDTAVGSRDFEGSRSYDPLLFGMGIGYRF